MVFIGRRAVRTGTQLEPAMSYVTGFLTPVPNANKDRYIKSAEVAWPLFRKYGALQQVET